MKRSLYLSLFLAGIALFPLAEASLEPGFTVEEEIEEKNLSPATETKKEDGEEVFFTPPPYLHDLYDEYGSLYYVLFMENFTTEKFKGLVY